MSVENPSINIPEELVCTCNISYDWEDEYSVVASSADHPAFNEVRQLLAKRGYIEIPKYACVNGDIVLKRFIFNGFQLEPFDTFYCAAAWANKIKIRNKK